MENPFFSIILPIYNRENTIAQAVDSVRHQSYQAWELLLADDGSTDGTQEICCRYAEEDQRIRLLRGDHQGVCHARNSALSVSRGEYVLFLDSDNSMKSNMLECLEREIKRCPDADVYCFGFSSSAERDIIPRMSRNQLVYDSPWIYQHVLPAHFNVVAQDNDFLQNYIWNKCFRRVFLQENGIIFDENRKLWEDGIFVVDCLGSAKALCIVPDVLYNAYCTEKVEHLSSKFFSGQTRQYIEDEKAFIAQYGDRIAFAGDHYCRSNFNVLKRLFQRMVTTFGRDALAELEQVIKEPLVIRWVKGVNPSDKEEKMLQKSILAGDAKSIYSLYHMTMGKRVANKLRSILR